MASFAMLIAVAVIGACSAHNTAEIEAVIPKETFAVTLVNNHPVEGYADNISYTQGATVNLHVSVPSTTIYTYTVYRYGASTANGTIDPGVPIYGPVSGTASPQSYPDNAAIVGLSWPITSTFTVGAGWKSGIYAVRLDSASGTSYVPFIVRDTGAAAKPRMLVASTNTWQAYNMWPYDQAATAISYYGNCAQGQVATTISFLRPNPLAWPDPPADRYGCDGGYGYLGFFYRNEHLAIGDIRIAQWLELSPLTSSYSVISDWDLDQAWIPNPFNPHGGYLDGSVLDPTVSPTMIISTHSEYWSSGMQRAVEAYQRGGGNIVTLSGNTFYHSVSFGSSNGGLQMTKGLTDWPAPVKTRVLGMIAGNTGGPAPCVPYSVTKPAHWLFASTAFSASPPPALGTSGTMAVLDATPNPGGFRTYCFNSDGTSPGAAGGASGSETDTAPPAPAHAHDGLDPNQWCTNPDLPHNCNCSSPGTSDYEPSRFVGFMRVYNRIADSSPSGNPSSIIFAQKASAGMLFNAGSIAFGQSLLWDGLQATTPMSTMLRNVFAKFGSRYFSDFDGDGIPDVVMRGGANLYMGRGNGQGGFVQGVVLVDSGGWDLFDTIVSVGDFNGDGHPDLIARCAAMPCPAGAAVGDILVYHGNGIGGLLGPGRVIASGWEGTNIIGVGDFDGDGNPDVIRWTNTANRVTLFKGNGHDGWISSAGTDISIDSRTFDMLIPIGDYNGDGTADVLARTSDGNLYLCRGTGDGTFVAGGCGNMINSGWNIFTAIIPVGDFRGFGQQLDGSPRPAMLGKNSSGQLVLYTGSGYGCVQTNYGVVDSGWNMYSPIVGVW